MCFKTFKSISLMIILLIIIASCAKPISISQKKNEENKTLRILSYNIRHGAPENSPDISMDNIASVIKMQNPDIVLLQEVDKNTSRAGEDQAKALGDRLKMYYFFSKSINYKGGEYGLAILSKYKIIKSESILLPNEVKSEQRSVALVTAEIPQLGEVVFASTHLDLKRENRISQISVLNNLGTSLDKPLILGGDFNATPNSTEISTLKRSFILPCSNSDCPKTFSAAKPDRTIDYIVLNRIGSDKLILKEYLAINGKLESDHLPLLAVYTFNAKSK